MSAGPPPEMPEEPDPISRSAAIQRWRLRRLLPVAAIGAALVAVYAFGWQRELSLDSVLGHRAVIEGFVAAHPATAVVAFIALYTAVTASAIPVGAGLAIIGGFLFGPVLGGFGAMAGSTIGATILFLVARSAIGESLTCVEGPLLASMAAGFRADAFNYIVFLRLVPTPSWLTSVVSGSLRVRLSIFVAATALGRLPGSFLFALFGAGLGGVIGARLAIYQACMAAGGSDCRMAIRPSDVLAPRFLAGLLGLAFLALLPVLAKRMRRARLAAGPETS